MVEQKLPKLKTRVRFPSPAPVMTKSFSEILIDWQKASGRHDLPWQGSKDPYGIWVSEIMLQQTQVSTVIPYYVRFMASFPDVERLASSSLDEVLAHWSGLGYYSRARNLHRTAKIVSGLGRFPEEPETLAMLPGIGRSTAAAIAVFAFSRRAAILDGNVKRVFSRVFGIEGYPGERAVEKRMWEKAEMLLPDMEMECYTQGLMDLGAGLCSRRNPQCGLCPMKDGCFAHRTGRADELPEARPRKALPSRKTTFFVLRHKGRFCFERRPESGIWAGLLAFPEKGEDLPDPSGIIELPPFTHVFTHFRLEIRVLVLESEKEGIWLTMDEALNAPIPNPVRKILEQIRRPSP